MKKVLVSLMMIAAIPILATYTMQDLMAESGPETTSVELDPRDTFPTSLHARGPSNGRENLYEDGIGRLTKIPFRDLPCQNCHAETYADGTPVDEATYEPGCKDCHATPGDQVTYTGNPNNPV